MEKINESNNYKHNFFRKTYLKFINNNDCTKLGFLHNIGSSCYLDSVLFSLFAIQNDFIDNQILFNSIKHHKENVVKTTSPVKDYNLRKLIQNWLIAITRSIRMTNNIKECSGFRSVMKKCQINGMPNFGEPGQQEAGEFLIYLLKLFKADECAKTKTTTYATNSLANYVRKKDLITTSKISNKKASIIILIDSFILKEKQHIKNSIHNFLNQKMDSGELDKKNLFRYKNKNYKRFIQHVEFKDSPYLIFWAQRAFPITNTVLDTKVIPNKKITLQSGRVLKLNSIIVHIGSINSGHYITYFRYNKTWYNYDDTSYSIQKIGNYKKMLKNYPNPITNGVLYFYSS